MFCFLDRRSFLTFMSRIGHENAQQIREIWLEWPAMQRRAYDELPSWTPPDPKAFPALPNLRTLHIRINWASPTTAQKWLNKLKQWPSDTSYARIRMYDFNNMTAVTDGWGPGPEPLIRGLFISNDGWSAQDKICLVDFTRSILLDSCELSQCDGADSGDFIINLRITSPTILNPTFYPDSMLKRAMYQKALQSICSWLSRAWVLGHASDQIKLYANYGPDGSIIDPNLLLPVMDHILNIHLRVTPSVVWHVVKVFGMHEDFHQPTVRIKIEHKQESYKDCAFCPPVKAIRAILGAMWIPLNVTQGFNNPPAGSSRR